MNEEYFSLTIDLNYFEGLMWLLLIILLSIGISSLISIIDETRKRNERIKFERRVKPLWEKYEKLQKDKKYVEAKKFYKKYQHLFGRYNYY